MKFTFCRRSSDMTEIEEYQTKELFSRFEKFFDGPTICEFVISRENNRDKSIRVDVTLIAGSSTYRATEVGPKYMDVTDELYEKIKKQIRRKKDKLIASVRE